MRLKLCASSIHGKFQMCVAHSTVPWTLAFECFVGGAGLRVHFSIRMMRLRSPVQPTTVLFPYSTC